MRNFPRSECGVFCISIDDIIATCALVEFIVLSASDYYDRKGPFYHVVTFYSQYRYGELSIIFLLNLSQDIPA